MDESAFVPEGIDQDSWLGFEQRIQRRRAQALADTARQALGAGDRRAALDALSEARTLSPDSSELDELERQLARPPDTRRRRDGVRLAIVLTASVMAWFAIDALRDPVEAPAPAQTYSAPIPPPAATSGMTDTPEPADTPVLPAPVLPAATVPDAQPPARTSPSTDEDRVASALKRYGRTFTGLNLADCAITMRAVSASAVCRTAGALPIWDVELSRHDEGWMIDSAVAREK